MFYFRDFNMVVKQEEGSTLFFNMYKYILKKLKRFSLYIFNIIKYVIIFVVYLINKSF
uniref:Uncharacterized 7.2 kDa protein in rps2-rps9 intergenic region n=1 Tax=Euglena longa TaxID=3037 RepID=YCX1_EUGLO|nr:hypothetical protein AsloCp10 [Euglena longa]P34774.1 RecName: Full=Uncharacterized 7.2 kDa protein in rps2-rps9 intergenic region; AltName: Full=ORF57 [Euglena longa]CAC24581.1 hypothetical protein [Euglena longa]